MGIALLWLVAQSPVAGVDVEPFPLHTGVDRIRATLRLRAEGRVYWALFREGKPITSSTTREIQARFDPPLHAGERLTFTVHVTYPDGRSVDDVVAIDVLNAPPAFRGADVQASGQEILIRPRFDDPEGDSLTLRVLKPGGFRVEGGVVRGPLPETFPITVELEVSDGTNTIRVTIPVEAQSQE